MCYGESDSKFECLISGLILEAQREEVQINEFAKTYLLIKFRPNNIEYMEKQDEISNYKRELTIKKNKLLDCRERNPQIDKSSWEAAKTLQLNSHETSLSKVKTAGSQYLCGFPFFVLAKCLQFFEN